VIGTPTHALLEQGISYVPQGRIIFPNLTVRENVLMGGFLLNHKQTQKERLEEVFDRFPVLREKQKERARTLSGGQQQQLALGRALMMRPKLLLLDEPSLGLSPKLQIEVFEKLKTLQAEGMSLLCVEQNVRLVLRYADRGYLLTGGAVNMSGSAEELGRPEVMERAFLR
jgi:branched-chain amino acid transport system ATP-binding protein